MDLKITTNNHNRKFSYRYEVPASILEDQFDYQDPEDITDGFFKYKGYWYHTDQFMSLPAVISEIWAPDSPMRSWHGVLNDSMCSGVLIRLSDDGEEYQVAWFCS